MSGMFPSCKCYAEAAYNPLGTCWAFNDLLTADPSGADERAVAHTADMVGRFSPRLVAQGVQDPVRLVDLG